MVLYRTFLSEKRRLLHTKARWVYISAVREGDTATSFSLQLMLYSPLWGKCLRLCGGETLGLLARVYPETYRLWRSSGPAAPREHCAWS